MNVTTTLAASVISALAAGTATAASPESRLPNLVVILADDLGYGDLGCYGHRIHRTPNIDRMAREGARFTDFYVTSPICTPTRVALLTGRHPVRVGFSALLWPTSSGGLPASERTLAGILREAGYATGLSGKWHLGHSEEKFLPLAHGFDHFYGMPYPNDMMPGHPVEKHFPPAWPPMPMMEGNEIVEAPVDVNLLTQQYTADAVRFIARHHREPFFLYLSHAMPHTIVGASPAFAGRSGNGRYGDAVEELDWSVGEIRRTLEAFGLLDNTLIVITSDNGAVVGGSEGDDSEERAARRRFFGDDHRGSNAPLRGGKQTTFEGGIRVPGIFFWPGRIGPERVVSAPAWIADVLPTFLAYAGLPLPEDRTYDGKSLVPLLSDTGDRSGADEFAFGNGTYTALRQGEWKLVLAERQPGFLGLRSKEPLLFNLRLDPGETTDLAAAEPERAAAMKRRLSELEATAQHDPISRPSPAP